MVADVETIGTTSDVEEETGECKEVSENFQIDEEGRGGR